MRTIKSQKETVDIFNKLGLFLKGLDIDCEADREKFQPAKDRANGVVFEMPLHVKGLVYAQLSSQQKWTAVVRPRLGQVDELFFHYDISAIKQRDGLYFNRGIRSLKCGNRSVSKWTDGLHYNISVLESIDRNNGGIDKYYSSIPVRKLIKTLSGGTYKLKETGVALACEYLGNIGIDRIKPDKHIRRIFGRNRLGYSRKPMATENEVLNIAETIQAQTGRSLSIIDALLWNFCADGLGQTCTENPKRCHDCPIAEHCNQAKQ